jgi:hypothetical protein
MCLQMGLIWNNFFILTFAFFLICKIFQQNSNNENGNVATNGKGGNEKFIAKMVMEMEKHQTWDIIQI